MRSNVTSRATAAAVLATVLAACGGCTALLTSTDRPSASTAFADAEDSIADGIDAVKEKADDSLDGVNDRVQQGRGQWFELMAELNRLLVFGDPKEMNSSQFDARSDAQLRAMRAEIDGGSPLR